MTAAELIASLQQLPADAPVYVEQCSDLGLLIISRVVGADYVLSPSYGEAVVIELED